MFNSSVQLQYHFEFSVLGLCHDACKEVDLGMIADGRWHHVVLSWNLAFAADIYVDGDYFTSLWVPGGQHSDT